MRKTISTDSSFCYLTLPGIKYQMCAIDVLSVVITLCIKIQSLLVDHYSNCIYIIFKAHGSIIRYTMQKKPVHKMP